jgi:hypothetical protein
MHDGRGCTAASQRKELILIKPLFTVALLAASTFASAATVARTAQPKTDRVTLPNGRQIFVTGQNLAWVNFGNDVGDAALDTNTFKQAVQDIRDAGGNSMRVWLSTNGANDPKFDSTTGLTKGLGTKTISNVKAMLSIANRNGVVLALDLLTHNLMGTAQVGSWNTMSIANNKKLMQTDSGLKAYIDKAVIPLVTAIGKDSGILCWEIFNEAEGMVQGWPGLEKGITMPDVQRVVNRVTGAIHRAVPGVLVSNGAVTFDYTTDVDGKKNYYTDGELIKAGGDSDGVLDFYMVHYYGWNGVTNSPFTKSFAHWKLDKPMVIGEFAAGDWSPAISSKNMDAAKQDTLLTYLYKSGYAGGLSWTWTGDGTDVWLGNYSTAKAGMQAVFKLDSAAIKIKDVVRVKQTGNGVLAGTLNISKSTLYPGLQYNTAKDFSKGTTFAFDVLVPSSAKGGLKVQPVFKTGDAWFWNASGVFCQPFKDSTWMTCEAAIADFPEVAGLNSVKAIVFQFIGASTFQGQVWIDNIRLDKDTLWNFNDGKVVFGVDTYNPTEADCFTGLDVVFPQSVSGTGISAASRVVSGAALSVSLRGKTLDWSIPTALGSAATLRVLDAQGRELSRSVIAVGMTSGSVDVTGQGLRLVVLESAQGSMNAVLPSVR